MLTVFCGNDSITVRTKAHALVHSYEEKGYIANTIDSDKFAPGLYIDVAEGVSLFGGNSVYLVDTPSSNKEMYEDTIANLESLKNSPHIFIIVESTLLAPEKKKFAKYSDSLEEFKATGTERFNVFALADALSRKDKKSLWLLLSEAKLAGIAPEEIVGTLWWELKTLRLATMTKNAEEAGMKDYPYNKAKRSLGKFKEGELEKLSHSLISLQHDSRLGKCDLGISLEQWVLGM